MTDDLAARPADGATAGPAPGSRRDASPAKLAFYRLVRGLLVAFGRGWLRLRVEGGEHVPADGPFVLAPVHRSNLDFFLVSSVTTRRMRYMGKDSLWRSRALGWLISALGAFPVRRGAADREALRTCLEVIRSGEPVVLFPEGTRRTGPVVESIFDGAAYVAGRAGVPILPVGIGGSERAMPRGAKWIRPVRVAVVVGRPFTVGDGTAGERVPRSAVKAASARLQRELQELFDLAQERVGSPNPPLPAGDR
ncbi:MAG TPA: lysophospholipid acyltransferase family protein [Acidimicrobiales bacterium]|jgi:1-acyl-sn-glycerol-3-phosphate acyltransferase